MVSELRYCPLCAAALDWRPLGDARALHPQCVACGFVLWQNPKPSVEALIVRGDGLQTEVLLGLLPDDRGGGWDLPGNFLNTGDRIEDALVRECRREMGIEVSVGDIVGAFDDDFYGTPIVVLVFVCRITGGEPRAADIIDAVQWFPLAGPPRLAARAVEAAIRAAQWRFGIS